MRIVFAGGGSGGHFYPILAIVESIQKITKEKKILTPEMHFFAPSPYNQGLLFDHNVKYKKIMAGKMRRYFSVLNFFDLFKTGIGVLSALFDVFDVYPDVIFSKGGYGSFPTVFAARLLRIPVYVHESDSRAGRVNKWAGKFAKRIATSYEEAVADFPAEKTVWQGQPILKEKLASLPANADSFFDFDTSVPTILILGGSQGAETINNAILDSLPDLVKNFQIVHQTGLNNLEVMKQSAAAILLDNPNRNRYKVYGYLNTLEMQMATGIASLVISRAGSTIFEIAAWGIPSIIIPIPENISHDQTRNAFAYARFGACSVIQEENLRSHILLAEIHRIVENPEISQKMRDGAKAFYKPGASDEIARDLLEIVLSHQKLE